MPQRPGHACDVASPKAPSCPPEPTVPPRRSNATACTDAPRLFDEVLPASDTPGDAHIDRSGIAPGESNTRSGTNADACLEWASLTVETRTDGSDGRRRSTTRSRRIQRTGNKLLKFNTCTTGRRAARAPDPLAGRNAADDGGLLHLADRGVRGRGVHQRHPTQCWMGTPGAGGAISAALDIPTHMLPPVDSPGPRLGTPLAGCVVRSPPLEGAGEWAAWAHDKGSSRSVPQAPAWPFRVPALSLLGTRTAAQW